MNRTLTDIIQAIDSKVDLDSLELSVEEEVLAGSFVHERTERPEMLRVVVEHEGLLTRYLGLPAEQRALLEGLRAKNPEYLEGDPQSNAPKRKSSPKPLSPSTWELYKDVHTANAITTLVKLYIGAKPTSRMGPVPLTAWFTGYDHLPPKDQKSITFQDKENAKPSSKYYQRWSAKSRSDPSIPDFEEWIIQQLPAPIRTLLQETPFFKKTSISLEETLENYIHHQPKSKYGPVPLTAWFRTYDPVTNTLLAPRSNGQRKRISIPPANKHHKKWESQHARDQSTPCFDEWILGQITPVLRERLKNTPYFQQDKTPPLTIEQTIEFYIKHKPTRRKGLVPLTSWFNSYNPSTNTYLRPQNEGKTSTLETPPACHHYNHWRNQNRDNPELPSFDEWILARIPVELREQLLQAPYFRQDPKHPLTIEQTLQYYIDYRPIGRLGPVPLSSWFHSYDPRTNTFLRPKIKGKTHQIETLPASKYISRWYTHRSRDPSNTLPFDDWILEQVSPELREKVLQTPYYQSKAHKGELS